MLLEGDNVVHDVHGLDARWGCCYCVVVVCIVCAGVIVTFLSVAAVIYIVGSIAFRSSVDMRENGRKWEGGGGG